MAKELADVNDILLTTLIGIKPHGQRPRLHEEKEIKPNSSKVEAGRESPGSVRALGDQLRNQRLRPRCISSNVKGQPLEAGSSGSASQYPLAESIRRCSIENIEPR